MSTPKRHRLSSVLLLVLLSACNLARSVKPIDLVPADAIVVLELHWQAVRSNPSLRSIAQWPADVASFRELGFSEESFQTVVMFSRLFSTEASTDGAIVFAPGMGRQIAPAATAHAWPSESLPGGLVYRQPGTTIVVSSVGDDVAVIGSLDSVQRVLQAYQDPRAAFVARQELADVLPALRSAHPITLTAVWPRDVGDATKVTVEASAWLLRIGGWEAVAALVEKLGIGRGYVVRLIPETGGVRVDVDGIMQDESSASTVATGLSLLKTVGSLMQPETSHGQSAPDLKTMTVERRGSVVSIGVVVRESR